MAGSDTRIKDIPTTVTSPASDDYYALDGNTNGTRKMLHSAMITNVAATLVADPTTHKLCPLNGSNKIDVTYLPASGDTPKGSFDPTGPTPNLTDGTGTAGDYYDVTVAGSHDAGSGSITYAVGDRAKYSGTVYFKIPAVANIFNGTSTTSGAATAGNYYEREDVDDRANARQPSNAVQLGDDGYLNPGAAYPSGSLTDKFTAIISVRFNSLPSGADAQFLMLSSSGTSNSATNGGFQIETDGTIDANIYDGAFKSVNDMLSGSVTLGKVYRLAIRLDSANDGVAVFSDGVKKGTAACGVTTASTPRWIIGANGDDNTGTEVLSFVCYNRVLSDAEIALEAVDQNVKVADQWGGTEITSGTLEVGQRYRITDFQAGDDYTNVGAGSNANDVEFIATGTTPTTWSNSSGVTPIGAVVALRPENIQSDGSIRDASSNGLHSAGTNTEPLRKNQIVEVDAASPAADSMLLDLKVAGSSKAGIDAEGTIRQENLATDAPVAKYAADAITTAGTVSHQIPIDIGGTTYYLVAHTHGS